MAKKPKKKHYGRPSRGRRTLRAMGRTRVEPAKVTMRYVCPDCGGPHPRAECESKAASKK